VTCGLIYINPIQDQNIVEYTLADRTNGRANAMCFVRHRRRLSLSLSNVLYVLWLNSES